MAHKAASRILQNQKKIADHQVNEIHVLLALTAHCFMDFGVSYHQKEHQAMDLGQLFPHGQSGPWVNDVELCQSCTRSFYFSE